jgi:toxin ParE1/3/4
VPRKLGSRLQVTSPAGRDLAAIAEWTLENFGITAERRYFALIRQALRDIEANPERLGSKQVLEGLRTYHIELSRARVTGSRVKDPRHVVLYRRRDNGVVEVLRIIHDSRDLERHLPEDSSQ